MRNPHCTLGHDRIEMYSDHINKSFVCEICGTTLTPESIMRNVPEAYRPQNDSVAASLQKLLNFEIRGIVMGDGKILIEYPRVGGEE